MILKDKNIVLCITGSIACYKAIELYRRLKKDGASIKIIMSSSAAKFISPYIFQSFGEEVFADDAFEKPLAHIELSKNADVIVIAPATFNTINKIAAGIADSLITLVVSASNGVPKILVPAMNERMYANEILKENLNKLKNIGNLKNIKTEQEFYIVSPAVGELACGDFGEGKFPEIEDIIFEIEAVFKNKKFSGKNILITAGATREYLDPVRFISNGSSGKMGIALANEAVKLGANVTLIACNIMPYYHCRYPYISKNIKIINAVSFQDLKEALLNEFPKNDLLIMAAAVSDFRFKEKSSFKIKKTGSDLKLNLIQNDDLLKALSTVKRKNQVIFGFAAETDNIVENAKKKLIEKSLDYIFVNDVLKGIIGGDESEGFLIKKDGDIKRFDRMRKIELAEGLLEEAGINNGIDV
jgi:phosphopantothenoylcysteine decarboxylase/phosphopantothenate--cysteine ligase